MPRGGSRKHPAGCSCGNCPQVGRKKVDRPTNASVAQKVLAAENAENTWRALIQFEKQRLGIGADGKLLPARKRDKEGAIDGPDYPGRYSIIPLVNVLRYLEDRAHGRPMENSTINHLHDKPIDMNVNLTVSERLRIALEKAEARVGKRRS